MRKGFSLHFTRFKDCSIPLYYIFFEVTEKNPSGLNSRCN